MQGQYYEETFEIKDGDSTAVEVTVGVTVDHNKVVTVDNISDLANQIAENLDGMLKHITDQ